jgi:hypothetical protein
MASENAGDYRARAAQARRISVNMHNRAAQVELRDMADALDAEAERLEGDTNGDPTTPPNKAQDDDKS